MSVQHNAITADADNHEPKGCPTATAGKAYVSDGAGSGVWTPVQVAHFACIRAASAGNTTGITTAYQAINNALLGGTITWSENNVQVLTTNTTSGYITITEAGAYHIIAAFSIVGVTNPSTFSFTIGIDSGSGIVSQESSILAQIKTTSTSDTKQAIITCLPDLAASDKVYLMVKEAAGNELSITALNFTISRVG